MIPLISLRSSKVCPSSSSSSPPPQPPPPSSSSSPPPSRNEQTEGKLAMFIRLSSKVSPSENSCKNIVSNVWQESSVTPICYTPATHFARIQQAWRFDELKR